MHLVTQLPWVIVALSAIAASITDVRFFKVHNRLTFPLLGSGILFHTVMHGWSGVQMSLAGAFFGLGVMLIPYVLGMMGAGDVKFVAAVGAWLGAMPMLLALGIGCIATGVYSVIVLARQGRLREIGLHLWLVGKRITMMGRHLLAEDDLEPVQDTVQRDDRRARLIPFSAMFSIGVFVLLVMAYTTVGTNS